MSIRAPGLAAAILLIGCASASAQVKDAVELLPAQTLACIELRHPARLSREVAALVKGSVLDDLPRRLSKMGGIRSGDYRFYQQRELLTFSSIFLCPEAISEAGRIGGGFIALTGFAKDNTPEVVGVLQTGSSNIPGVMMRAFVTETSPKLVGEVEGVSLYRKKNVVYSAPTPPPGFAPAQAPRPEERESGPVIGQLPGLILFGSSVDSLKGLIRRAKSKSAGPSLTSLRAYKESAELRDRPGLFAYVDAAALEAKLDELNAIVDEQQRLKWLTALKTLLGSQTFRSLTFSLTLNRGALEGQMRFQLDGKNDSPLLGLLPDRAIQRELLHFAPNDALLALAGGLGDNEKRYKTVLNLLDAIYKLRGSAGDNRPSRAIEEMEKKLDFRITDLLATVTGAGVAFYNDPAKDVLLLRATDEKAAAQLDKNGLPRLFSLGEPEVRVPTEEEVLGRKIKTVKGGWNGVPVHYGKLGATLVLGLEKERIAAVLIAGGKKGGLLADTKVSAAVKDVNDKAVAVGVLFSARVAMDLLAVLSRPSMPRAIKMGAPPVPPPPPPPPAEQLPDKTAESSKPVQALLKAFEPLVFSLNRQPESLVLEMRPLPLRRMTPLLLDAWVEMLLKPSAEGPPALPAPLQKAIDQGKK